MNHKSASIPLLLILALATDLLTPLAIWKGVLPAQVRWISHAAIAGMIVAVYMRIMLAHRVPNIAYVAGLASATGIAVALFHGQSPMTIAWGGWVLLQFPLVGLYAYLWPRWPDRLADRLCSFCVIVLAIQVVVQIVQYLLGEVPGDDLAGLFGWHGTGDLAVFIVFSYCLALGKWLTNGRWGTAAVVLVLGSIASVLGEMKLFPFSILALAGLVAIIVCVQKRKVFKLVPLAAVSVGILLAFIVSYDRIVLSDEHSGKSMADFFSKERLNRYLGNATLNEEGVYYLGRNYALAHGWKTIRKDNFTTAFGFGLGARSESQTLGTLGTALQQENLSFTTGSGLLILMQEMGAFGLLLLALAIAWVVWTLIEAIRRSPPSPLTQLHYGLLLFSLLWPLWFWYTKVLTLRVPMLLYWAALGYVLAEFHRWWVASSRPADTLNPTRGSNNR